jgi:hypothetical protein
MEEKRSNSVGIGVFLVCFLVGLVCALAVGWVLFPKVLFSEERQPINFPHASHQDSSCEDCHYLREDGTYSGVPGIENCRECHEEPQTDSEDEQILVEKYIQEDKEIPWKIYARQPDNVYFSHAAHLGEGMECTQCHRKVEDEEQLPPYLSNRLTGYVAHKSGTEGYTANGREWLVGYGRSTMKMIDCEKCHVEKGASNACGVCHK